MSRPKRISITEPDLISIMIGASRADITISNSEEAISTAPQRVARVLDALPDRYRLILESRFLRGNSIKESAAELGISVPNAKVLQHRALRLAAQVNDGGKQ